MNFCSDDKSVIIEAVSKRCGLRNVDENLWGGRSDRFREQRRLEVSVLRWSELSKNVISILNFFIVIFMFLHYFFFSNSLNLFFFHSFFFSDYFEIEFFSNRESSQKIG